MSALASVLRIKSVAPIIERQTIRRSKGRPPISGKLSTKFKDFGIGIKEMIFIAKDVTTPIIKSPSKSKIEIRNCKTPR
jgi:hypothetical protein